MFLYEWVGVIDISDDDSVDGFAVGGDSAGKVIHLKSDGIGMVDRASEAPPRGLSGRMLANLKVTLCNSGLRLLIPKSGS